MYMIFRFKVVYCSSQAEDAPAEELNVHSPQTKGWQSVRLGSFPQEVILELIDGPARISKVQILSHQSKIASKIEIHVGSGKSFDSASYQKLGKLSLDPNEKSNYQARELKTVYVDAEGTFVKFVLFKNYANELNFFGQVGIVAINLMGESLESHGRQLQLSGSLPSSTQNTSAGTLSNLADISNDLNLDAPTAYKIKLLAEAKAKALQQEDFATCKLIKSIEGDIKDLGFRLAKLDIAKKKAVETEDFDRALQLKEECNTLREAIESKIKSSNLSSILDMRPPTAPRAQSSQGPWISNVKDPYDVPISGRKVIDVDSIPVGGNRAMQENEFAVVPSNSQYDDDSRPIRPQSKAKDFEQYQDEDDNGMGSPSAMVPYQETFPPGEHPLEGVYNFLSLPTPEELFGKDKDAVDSSGILGLVGDYRARCLKSKNWVLRDAALSKTTLMIPDFEDDPGISITFPVIAAIAKIGLEDKMQQVFQRALVVLDESLAAAEEANLSRSAIAPILDPIIAILIDKLTDTNARVRDGAKKGLEIIISTANAGGLAVSPHALKTINNKNINNWKLIVSRLKLLSEIVGKCGMGIHTSGLTVDSVMSFMKACTAFTHSNHEVRQAAQDLTVSIQKQVGSDAILPLLTSILRKAQLDEYLVAFGIETSRSSRRESSIPAIEYKQSPAPVQSSSKQQNSTKPPPPNASQSKPSSNNNQQSKYDDDYYEDDYSQPAATKTKESQDYTTCMFCGERDKSWNEDALDLHYWKHCPLLTPCPACTQVVEIAGLPDHLLEECEQKHLYESCDVTGNFSLSFSSF